MYILRQMGEHETHYTAPATDHRHLFTLSIAMSWSIANAKQQFSEVVRLCAQEPQPVFNRSRQVAVVISAEDYAAFEAWRTAQQTSAHMDVAGLFAQAREALRDQGLDGLDLPARSNRPDPDLGFDAEPKPALGARAESAHAAE